MSESATRYQYVRAHCGHVMRFEVPVGNPQHPVKAPLQCDSCLERDRLAEQVEQTALAAEWKRHNLGATP